MSTMRVPVPFSNPKEIAETGERIYHDKYQQELEREHRGKFVAIDVSTEEFFLGEYPEDALQAARKAVPNGIFHLIKIGSPAAYRMSALGHEHHQGLN